MARAGGHGFALAGTTRAQDEGLWRPARLIGQVGGSHLWSERFDARLDNTFSIQDEITRQVALAVQVGLADGASAQMWEGQTHSLRAWEKMVEARHLFLRFNRADNLRATEALVAAIDIDPAFLAAMVHLALCHLWHAGFDQSADLETGPRQAGTRLAEARAIRPDIGIAFGVEAPVAVLRDRHCGAHRLPRLALDRTPGDPLVTGICSMASNDAGAHEDAITLARQDMRLSPQYSAWFTCDLALSHLWLGDLGSGTRFALDTRCARPRIPAPRSCWHWQRACRGTRRARKRRWMTRRAAFLRSANAI